MKRKKTSLGCLFWIALILLILVIFLFNKSTIETVLDNTGFLDLFSKKNRTPEVERIETPAEEASRPAAAPAAEPVQTVPEETKSPEPRPEEVVKVVPPEETAPAAGQTAPETPETPVQDARVRRSRLYFVMVDTEGKISLKGVIRPVYYKDSPLTETLNNLLKGLSASELNEGLLTLIPEGTVLRSVAVRDSTAYIDFTEEFLFNSFGQEGYAAQLEQVVFTTLEFSTVKRVQILINGKKQDYMGVEGGIFIGQPLTRESF